MAIRIISTYVNDFDEIKAEVYRLVGGDYCVRVSDTDAKEIVGYKAFQGLEDADYYASKCVFTDSEE